MPLKHHTETAFLLVLMLVIAVTGLAVSLLPAVPDGLLYWGVLFVASIVYPIALLPLFRTNRADYEFRFLHWFPALMLVLWLVLESLGHVYALAFILLLGMTFLWSLPLVFFGAFLIIFFALHVIRRRVPRVIGTLVIICVFLVGSIVAEATEFNAHLATTLFPSTVLSQKVAGLYKQWFPAEPLIAGLTSSSQSVMMFPPINLASSSVAPASTASMIDSYNFPPPSSAAQVIASSRRSLSSVLSSSQTTSVRSSSAMTVVASQTSTASSHAVSSVSSSVSSHPVVVAVSSQAVAPISSSSMIASVVVTSVSSLSSSSSSTSSTPSLASAVSAVSSSIITDINSYNVPSPNPDILASRDAMEKLKLMARNRHRLPRSGPEDVGVLALTLLAIYSGIIHYRAKKRI